MTHRLQMTRAELPIAAGTNLPRKLRGKPFQPGHDPRRNLTKGGRPSDEFIASMRALASSDAVLAALTAILKDEHHEHFIRAHLLRRSGLRQADAADRCDVEW